MCVTVLSLVMASQIWYQCCLAPSKRRTSMQLFPCSPLPTTKIIAHAFSKMEACVRCILSWLPLKRNFAFLELLPCETCPCMQRTKHALSIKVDCRISLHSCVPQIELIRSTAPSSSERSVSMRKMRSRLLRRVLWDHYLPCCVLLISRSKKLQ
jgi:hypothetical protein